MEPTPEGYVADILSLNAMKTKPAYYCHVNWCIWVANWFRNSLPDHPRLFEVVEELDFVPKLNKLFESNLMGLVLVSLSSECQTTRNVAYWIFDQVMEVTKPQHITIEHDSWASDTNIIKP